ncbi:MAG: hypothetical protein QM764_17755 [Chitinophagaceae bacterium]
MTATPPASSTTAAAPNTAAGLLANYDRDTRTQGEPNARAALFAALASQPEPAWLQCAQQLVLRGRADVTTALLTEARRRHPASIEIAFALAGLERRAHREREAEALLREVLAAKPITHRGADARADDRRLGRTKAAADVLRSAFVAHRQPIDLVIQAMELLDDYEREADASAIAEAEIAAGARIRAHAYAATYAIQLGDFARARERFLFRMRTARRRRNGTCRSGSRRRSAIAAPIIRISRCSANASPDATSATRRARRCCSAWARRTTTSAIMRAPDIYVQAKRF